MAFAVVSRQRGRGQGLQFRERHLFLGTKWSIWGVSVLRRSEISKYRCYGDRWIHESKVQRAGLDERITCKCCQGIGIMKNENGGGALLRKSWSRLTPEGHLEWLLGLERKGILR